MYFSDFSTNFYGISKFTAKITKRSLLRNFEITPQIFAPFNPRSLAIDRPNPATAIAGGEGGGAWEVQQAKAHLWVAWEVEGRVGARASTVSNGCWSSGHGGRVASVEIG